jgi:hypothetical protein
LNFSSGLEVNRKRVKRPAEAIGLSDSDWRQFRPSVSKNLTFSSVLGT